MKVLRRLHWIALLAGSMMPNLEASPRQIQKNPVHIDLDADGHEYLPLHNQVKQNAMKTVDLQVILAAGKRNLQWVDYMNSFRPEDRQFLLSSAETQIGYPIHAPTTNNEDIIVNDFNQWRQLLPSDLHQLYFSSAKLPKDPPISDAEFIVTSRKIDRLYQRTSRWLLQQPHLEYYRAVAKEDIRGYYHLTQETDLRSKLENWSAQDVETKARLTKDILDQCFNSESMSRETCQNAFNIAVADNQLFNFHSAYHSESEKLYKMFFDIPQFRSDVTWTAAEPNLMSVPFANPNVDKVLTWLRDNIEDEWKWNGWQLRLNFIQTASPDTTHIDFVEGTTPHVNEIAGSIITMDGNRSLSEYNSRWTIRHEYGHVLGFPDCYIEFFDESISAMVSYQLDITNLMCSRRGHLQQKHFDALQKVYFKE